MDPKLTVVLVTSSPDENHHGAWSFHRSRQGRICPYVSIKSLPRAWAQGIFPNGVSLPTSLCSHPLPVKLLLPGCIIDGKSSVDEHMAVSANFHEYFHQNGNKIPPSAHDNPYTFHFQTGGVPIFEWMARFPARIASFNMAMTTASTQGTASITLFPWRKAITTPTTAEAPLVVDVGGGRGHAAQVIREQLDGVPGRVIVQDLAGTIDGARNEHPDVEKMAHNFFDLQPVKGTIRTPLLIISHPPRSSPTPTPLFLLWVGVLVVFSLIYIAKLTRRVILFKVPSSILSAGSSTTGQMRLA